MKTFYSILYCPTRPASDEKMSIALLVFGKESFFRFSNDKLNFIKNIIPNSPFNLLRASLRNIENLVDKKNGSEILSNTEDPFLTLEYVNYLSKYTNNLMTFSKPIQIELEATKEIFDKLYEKFIFEFDKIEEPAKKNSISTIKKRIEHKIRNSVNLNIELDKKNIKDLIVPTKVWFIGKNEHDVTGETIDFDINEHAVENHLRSYIYLIEKVKNSDNKSTCFLIGKEPAKSKIENHKMWADISKLKSIKYLDPQESGKIEEYIKKHGVTPFVKSKT